MCVSLGLHVWQTLKTFDFLFIIFQTLNVQHYDWSILDKIINLYTKIFDKLTIPIKAYQKMYKNQRIQMELYIMTKLRNRKREKIVVRLSASIL